MKTQTLQKTIGSQFGLDFADFFRNLSNKRNKRSEKTRKIEEKKGITFRFTRILILNNHDTNLLFIIKTRIIKSDCQFLVFFHILVLNMEKIIENDGNGEETKPNMVKKPVEAENMELYMEIARKMINLNYIPDYDYSIKLLTHGESPDTDVYVLKIDNENIYGNVWDFYGFFQSEAFDKIHWLSKDILAQFFSEIQLKSQNLIYNQLGSLIKMHSITPEKLIKIQIFEIRNQLKHSFNELWETQMDLEYHSTHKIMVTA